MRLAIAVAAAMTALIPLLVGTSDVLADTPTPSPPPQVTSDLVLLVNDSYGAGEFATISIRNDGEVAYKIPNQPACSLAFKDASTARSIIVAGHCDLPGYGNDLIEPDESVPFLSNWDLTECIEPGFFCSATRPLPTGQYTISGALPATDGQHLAEFSKTVSITGPQFTSDLKLVIGRIVSDPPTGTIPAFIELRNESQREYTVPGCFLRFYASDHRFSIPPLSSCDDSQEDALSPGETIRVVGFWNLDECKPSSTGICGAPEALAPGTYTLKGAVWSADRQAYAEFSTDLTVPPTPSTTPGDLPKSGSAPDAGLSFFDSTTALAIGAVLAGFASFVLLRAAKVRGRRQSL